MVRQGGSFNPTFRAGSARAGCLGSCPVSLRMCRDGESRIILETQLLPSDHSSSLSESLWITTFCSTYHSFQIYMIWKPAESRLFPIILVNKGVKQDWALYLLLGYITRDQLPASLCPAYHRQFSIHLAVHLSGPCFISLPVRVFWKTISEALPRWR